MKSKSQKRFGTFASLTVLTLLTFATAVQAATMAGSAAPPAGTEGRGGADLSAGALVVSTASPAGTEGRGGATMSAVAIAPRAATEGRGGVAAALPQPAPGPRAEAFVSRARGGYPAWPAGIDVTAALTPGSSTSTGWIAAGLVTAAVVLIVGFLAWAANRRRVWLRQSPLGSYCAYHPADSIC